jgi:flagella basal body P-ring formation protein FlgA
MIRMMLALFALLALAHPATAQFALPAPSLKAEAIVKSEIVRIGDLVNNAGAAADVPIFRAPDLGETGSVSASRVAAAVSAHIDDLDTRGLKEVVVTRASRMITAKDFETRIERALANRIGARDRKNLTFSFDNEVHTIYVEPEGTELHIARLNYEPRSGRFDVWFRISGSAAMQRALRFTGTLAETFEALVLTHRLARGEIVRASDLTMVRRPKAQFATTLVTGADQAVGLAARHVLQPGQLLRQTDLMKPELVGRNDAVTITYQVPGIVLNVRGEAKEAGALGDIIDVINAQSKKVLRATVIGPGRVSVGAAPARVASNTTAYRR